INEIVQLTLCLLARRLRSQAVIDRARLVYVLWLLPHFGELRQLYRGNCKLLISHWRKPPALPICKNANCSRQLRAPATVGGLSLGARRWGSDPQGLTPNKSSPRPGALVLPVVDEVVHHGRLGQGGGIPEVGEVVLGDLSQDAAHDLAGARLRQARGE